MMFNKILIANRGEIAVRVIQSAAGLGMSTVAVYSEDDEQSLHVYRADEAWPLAGEGASAYLDQDKIIEIASTRHCDAIHPGYGFLSENGAFAENCAKHGIRFIGPSPATLKLLGDKAAARKLAKEHGVPLLNGTDEAVSLDEARSFFDTLDGRAMIIKAVAGGGGRGVRIVESADELESAFTRCASEAGAAFGNDALYVEEFMPHARHIEVQVLGDDKGQVMHLGERDCSIQRRHQKIIEIAPAPNLPDSLRERITAAAIKLGKAANYQSAGTFEFLVDVDREQFAFMEANARLQVEHTITEAVMDVDIVEAQLRLAAGESLRDLALKDPQVPRGYAIQLRVNMETMQEDGTARPAGGIIKTFNPPSGPGIRLDTFGYTGYAINPRFDSLLAKLIVHHKKENFEAAISAAYRALCEFQIDGVSTNIPFLQNLLTHERIRQGDFYTRFVDDNLPSLVKELAHERHYVWLSQVAKARQAGARLENDDPLAVLTYGQQNRGGTATTETDLDDSWVLSPMQGTIIEINVKPGDEIIAGQTLLVMDSMKMEHEIRATFSGVVGRINVEGGETIYEKQPLMSVEAKEVSIDIADLEEEVDLDELRPDLKEVVDRRLKTLDENRPDAVERRRRNGQRTARENIEDLCDQGTFIEYGQLVLAAQRRRRSLEELIEKSPADGMITGVGSINGDLFPEPDNRCAVLSYDYTVFAGTQGGQNHRKTDRMINVAEQGKMPLVLFAEGGGGRPGDTDGIGGETTTTFARFAQLSGLVPMVGITSGRCFAGNASLLGCCDVIIATANSTIGMGGPAMIEGGGLGIFTPEEIGPMSVQVPNGVVDIPVSDEAEAVTVAKKYLSYFQGRLDHWTAPDQRLMRRIVPENRLRAYNVRLVIETLADEASVLELREHFGIGSITALIRVEGMPLGVIANNPSHLGGAIDSDGADKAARFMQLCDGFDIPILHLCDTPGIMVGPEIEKTALVRHSSRMFLTGANLSVPFFTIILRKAYGLGAIAMAGGSYKTPLFSVAWPTGEFGGMGLEGSVKLGYRNELAAIEDPEERKQRYEEMVAAAYERGKALNYASLFSVDDTIDPADSRRWVANLMKSVRIDTNRQGKKRPAIDAW